MPDEPYTSDDLADAIVDRYLAYFYGTDAEEDPLIEFTPVNPVEVAEVIVEQSDYLVFVFPDGETEAPFDHGDAVNERLTVAVVVNGPAHGNYTRALALKFVKQLRTALRGTKFDDFSWESTEVDPLWDVEALKTKGQFLSAFRATYYGIT